MGILKKWIRLEGLSIVSRRLLYIVAGILVICLHGEMRNWIHVVVGVAILLITGSMFAQAIRRKSYRVQGDRRLPTAAVGFILGVMILVRQHGAIPLIAIAWGLNGLNSGITELDHAIYALQRHERFAGKLAHGLLETALALMLVFDPYEKIGEHILILGIEMIVQALAATDEYTHTAPQTKEKSRE